jgi:hypothetical protein
MVEVSRTAVGKKVEQLSFKLEEKKESFQKPHLQVFGNENVNNSPSTNEEAVVKKVERTTFETAIKNSIAEFDIPTHNIEMPRTTNRGVPTEQKYVQKGQVITHYEEDIDVPTFLRKQMQ